MNERRTKRQRELTPTERDFYLIAKDVQRRTGQEICAESTEDRRFREFFGTGVKTAMDAWSLLLEHDKLDEGLGIEIAHLLWAMYFLKCYPLTEEGCAAAGTAKKGAIDPKTWRKYLWPMIFSLADLENEVIIFEDRRENPDHDTHLSVDCTDVRIPQGGPTFASHKFKGKSGLRYEIAIGILTGHIKWLNGPFPCGDFPDLTIFRQTLLTCLDDFERVEADDGYDGEAPLRCKVPSAIYNPEEAIAYQKRVQGRHETVNERLKNFSILTADPYRHDIKFHGYVFRAVAVLVQLSIANGDELFQTEDYQCAFDVEL